MFFYLWFLIFKKLAIINTTSKFLIISYIINSLSLLLLTKTNSIMKNLFKNLKAALLLTSTILLVNCSTESTTEEKLIKESVSNEIKAPGNPNETEGARTETTWKIKRYVFCRTNGAAGAGHVGVGFELRSTNPTAVYYYAGAVEMWQTAYSVPRGANNDGWRKQFTTANDMFAWVKKHPYNYNRYVYEASFKDISYTEVTNTYNKLLDFPNRGYTLNGNNCMNAAYEVLTTANSVYVPNPAIAPLWLPNGWYNAIASRTSWSNSQNL